MAILIRRTFSANRGQDDLFSKPDIGSDKEQKNGSDYTVHGEKGCIETPHVLGRDDGVFVCEEHSGSGNAQPARNAEMKKVAEGNEQGEHGQMHDPRCAKCGGNSERLRNTVKSCLTIVLKILTGVEDVEATDPEHHRHGKNEDAWIEATANCYPCG